MKKSHHITYIYSCLVIITSLCTIPVSVNAAPLIPSNGTLTSFNATTGDLNFQWDQGSSYLINGTDVTLYDNDITIPGAGVIGTIYEFVIPNFYDPLPMKTIDITMQGRNASAGVLDRPSVLDIIGSDSDFINGGPALPVLGSYVSGTSSSTLVTEHWEMFPNPDFETVKIYVPATFELRNITISTQSTVVPLPAGLWLFGSGLIGLIGLARRRQ